MKITVTGRKNHINHGIRDLPNKTMKKQPWEHKGKLKDLQIKDASNLKNQTLN
tara:strand:+ start:498 stop:656 length:159 start_codon:yes stop_codon:yes gene_type:complete